MSKYGFDPKLLKGGDIQVSADEFADICASIDFTSKYLPEPERSRLKRLEAKITAQFTAGVKPEDILAAIETGISVQ